VRVKVIADVHGDLEAVRREAATCDVLLLLGDLINVVDYENAGGIIAEVYGPAAVRRWSTLRADGRFEEARAVLREAAGGREEDLRALFLQKIDEAHRAFCTRVPSNTIVTFGNVDVPWLVRRYLPPEVRFADGEALEIDGVRFGFVGGGLPKVGIPGEVPLEDYERKVAALGPVDVLCAHVPPDLEDLTYDVVANLNEPGSVALRRYIEEHQPAYVYFGHVHQPRVARQRVGPTLLVNVGHHFRTTGRAVAHPAGEAP
jgi:Icc-related predicted phosphoesterase